MKDSFRIVTRQAQGQVHSSVSQASLLVYNYAVWEMWEFGGTGCTLRRKDELMIAIQLAWQRYANTKCKKVAFWK